MPLFTYIVSFKGDTYVTQARRSNFRGFGDWANIPPKELPQLTPKLRKELDKSMYGGFEEVPNQKRVWRNTILLNGSDLVVYAVQTDD
jgi:hypothetical protein